MNNDKRQDLRANRLDMWESVFWQCTFPVNLNGVETVIDFGSGRNLSKAILQHYDIKCTTVDVSPVYEPDIVSPIVKGIDIPKADFVSAFQCLEHNQFEKFVELISTLKTYSKKYVCISLPYDGLFISFKLAIRLPKLNWRKSFFLRRCGYGGRDIDVKNLSLDGNPYRHHYWEVGNPSYKIKDLSTIIENDCQLKIRKIVHSSTYPGHIFFLMEI